MSIQPILRFKTNEYGFKAWDKTHLSQIATVTMGQSPSSESYNEDSEGLPLIQGNADIVDGFTKPQRYTTAVTKRCQEGDVILSVRAPVGELGIASEESCIGRGVCAIRANDKSNTAFIYQLLQAKKKQWKTLEQGSTFTAVSGEDVKSFEVVVPTKEEQQKIASFFSMLDEKISIEEKKLACFKRLKKGVKRKIFSREIRFKDKFVNNTHEWKALRLRDICTSFSGGTPKSTVLAYYDGEIPFIRSGEIHSETTELTITEEGLNSSTAKMVHKGDLLYALYGATSGECDISQIEGAINQAILCIRPKSKSDINVSYLNEYLSNEKNCIVAKYLQGGQGNLSAAIVMNIMCEFPSKGEQDVIAQFLDEINKKIRLAEQKLQALNKLKRFFLQTMFV